MSKLFKLIKKEFVDDEWRWTYELKITFNYRLITHVTITDHYLEKHTDVVNNKLILNILKDKLDKEKVDPLTESYLWDKDVFLWEIDYQKESYRLIFWFKKELLIISELEIVIQLINYCFYPFYLLVFALIFNSF